MILDAEKYNLSIPPRHSGTGYSGTKTQHIIVQQEVTDSA